MALAEKSSPRLEKKDSLERPLLGAVRFDWEIAAYSALVLFALITRFWDLGARAMHHDESLHAIYSWYLYTGKGYQHDPMMHGPFQFHAVALSYLLFGASDFTARLVAALFGVWVVAAPYFLRREMGRTSALIAAALFALSPGFLYFSRFIRNDIYMAGWAMMIVIGIFGYIRERRPAYFYLLAAGTAFSFATKETVYITGFAFLTFFVLEALFSLARRRPPVGWAALRSLRARDWVIAIAIFLLINLLLYTTFFTNPKGILSGTTGALSYWLAQHDVQRGGQPWFYYLLLLPLYEFLPLAAALGGFLFVTIRGTLYRISLFTSFVLVWFLVGAVIYSWAGEKMPWLSIHLTQPLIFLAAISLAGLLKRSSLRLFTHRGGLISLGLAGFLAATVLGGLVAAPPLAGTQLGMQTEQIQRAVMWLLAGGTMLLLGVMAARNGAPAVLVPVAIAMLAALFVLTVRSGWEVAFNRGDIPRDMLVYVQTSPDVPRVVEEIERISYRTGAGKDMKILLDGGYTENGSAHESIAWPFEWYLRDYRAKSYYSKTFTTPTDAPVILSMVANQQPIRDSLENYVPNRGRLNWWYPEDYKTLTWDKVIDALTDASVRAKLWRYFLYKETFNSLGSRDFDFLVRSDLARGIPVRMTSGMPIASVPEAPAGDVIAHSEGNVTIYGKTPGGASFIREPRGVAVAPDGMIYVADAAASRIVAFRPDGTVARQWGAKGNAQGEFNEPWGIVVAPNGDVYVADTWNHRIQRFDAEGNFLATWGSFADAKGQLGVSEGAFWGPRDIAVTPDGRVLVTDTGNKRVQVFDLNGNFITMFGGEGSDPGQLREPVGIAVGADGSVYVADTWNRRIQKFDDRFQPAGQFDVPAWESRSVINKPYIDVDQQGMVYYTEPESHRVVVLNSDGQMESALGGLGSSPQSFNSPVGVDVSPSGELIIADGRNSRVVKHRAWR